MAAPAFFTPFPPYYANWEQSNNSGATYGSPLATGGQIVGPIGTQRFRQRFTIPPGLSGVFNVTVQGDIVGGLGSPQIHYGPDPGGFNPASPAFFSNVTAAPQTFTFPITAGNFIFELWIGGTGSVGETQPLINVTYGPFNAVMDCVCCVFEGQPICYSGSPSGRRDLFQAVAVIQNPGGFGTTALARTINGDIRGTAGGVVIGGGLNPVGMVIEYTFANPIDLVESIELYNGGQNPADGSFQGNGIITAGYEVYNATGAMTASGTLNVANQLNGTITTFLPNLLRNVKSVRLLNLTNDAVANIGWRQLLVWSRPILNVNLQSCDGDVSLFDPVTGLGVTQAEIVDCNANSANIISTIPLTNFVMSGQDFSSPGASADNICNVIPAPTSTTNFTLAGSCYDPTSSTVTMTWAGPVNSVEMTHGIPDIADSGIFLSFSDSGGVYNWLTNTFGMNVGQSKTSLIRGDGRQLKFTYLSGPNGTSDAPLFPGFPADRITLHGGGAGAKTPIHFKVERIA